MKLDTGSGSCCLGALGNRPAYENNESETAASIDSVDVTVSIQDGPVQVAAGVFDTFTTEQGGTTNIIHRVYHSHGGKDDGQRHSEPARPR